MEINNNNSETLNWTDIPYPEAIFQYLNFADLLELSKTCKFYNNKLSTKHRQKVSLIGYPKLMPKLKILTIFRKKKTLTNMLYFMKNDLGIKLQLIKEVTFNDSFNNSFIKKFPELFPNLKKLIFKGSSHSKSLQGLSNILYGLSYLEQIEFWINEGDTFNYNTTDQIFPKTLKSILTYIDYYNPSLFSIFDQLDYTYINLTTLSVTSNEMLINLSKPMTNLKVVYILNYWDLDNLIFIEFIAKNPQLIKLSIKFALPNNEVYNSLLNLKNLNYLSIDKYSFMESDILNLPLNYSINHLVIGRKLFGYIALELINSCKNLKIVEFIECDLTNIDSIKWYKINNKINTLNFIDCHLSAMSIKNFDNLYLFNKAEFTSSHCINDILQDLNRDGLKNYKLIPSVEVNANRFYIIKN